MPSRRVGIVLTLLFASAGSLPAQTPVQLPRQLSLARALELARQNSPQYRQVLNDIEPAHANVRSAQLSQLPTLGTSAGLSYTGSGRSTFGGTTFNQSSATVGSSYGISASWDLSVRTFLAPSQAKAQERATEANIASAGVSLVSDVTTQYLTALRAVASVDVARRQVQRYDDFLTLAQARFRIGSANILDVRQAEVNRTRAQVTVLQAERAATESKIELVRRLGVAASEDVDSMQLTDVFPLVEPRFQLDELRRLAHEQNPALRALDAQADAARIGVKSAKSDYLPSFNISTGINGYTQQYTNTEFLVSGALLSAQGNAASCQYQNNIITRLTSPLPGDNGGIVADCFGAAGLDASGQSLQPGVAQTIRSSNGAFPFNFTRSPWSIRLGISLPVWDGYARAARVSSARAQEDDARESVRAQQLQLDGGVQAQLLAVRTAWQVTGIQDTNRVAARDQLQLAQERYRIGNGTALEVADAQNAVTQAEFDYIAAVYDYHLAVAGLEAFVGRPLR